MIYWLRKSFFRPLRWAAWLICRVVGSRVMLFVGGYFLLVALGQFRASAPNAADQFGITLALIVTFGFLWRVASTLTPHLRPKGPVRRREKPAKPVSVPVARPMAFPPERLTERKIRGKLDPALQRLLKEDSPS